MDHDDPEQRIAELERQIAETKAAAQRQANPEAPLRPWPTPGASPQPSSPQPSSPQPPPSQPYPPSMPPPGQLGEWNAAPMPSAPQFGGPTAPPRWASGGRAGWQAWAVFLVLVVGLTFAVFHFALSGRSSHHSSSSSYSTAVPKPPTDLLSGLGTLLTDIRGRFGDTTGYSLHVRAEDASLYRADPASTGNQTLYSYIDGKWQSGGGNPTPPSGTGLADLGKFDVAAVTATVKSAPQTLHVPAGDKVYLVVYGQPDGSLTMRIFDDGKGDSDMEINPDGSIKEVHLH